MLKEVLNGIIGIGAYKLVSGILNFKSTTPIFKLVDENGKSIVTGSVKDCSSFVEIEEITGELLPENIDFGTMSVDGSEVYPIVYVGDKITHNYSSIIFGGVLLIIGIGTYCLYRIKKKEKKEED